MVPSTGMYRLALMDRLAAGALARQRAPEPPLFWHGPGLANAGNPRNYTPIVILTPLQPSSVFSRLPPGNGCPVRSASRAPEG